LFEESQLKMHKVFKTQKQKTVYVNTIQKQIILINYYILIPTKTVYDIDNTSSNYKDRLYQKYFHG